MRHVRALIGRLTYANVIATLALFVALGGASYAAIVLPAHSVGPRQLRTGAVTPAALSFPLGVTGATTRRSNGSTNRSATLPIRLGSTSWAFARR